MSHRPTDWHILDLDKDPTPGDPQRIRKLAGTLHDFADDVADALRDLKGIATEDEILSWAGKTAKTFADQFGDAPKQLRKLRKSYDLAGDALASFWPDLEIAQTKADKALRDGRKARDELTTAQTALTGANDWVHTATAKADSYDPAKNPGKDIPPPDEADVRRATRDAQHAKTRQATAERNVENAQNALDAAKKLADQAKGLREEAARRTVTKLKEASDAGIPNRHWWEEIGDWVADHWDEIVTVCKWVVAVVGIIVMIIGGPLGWLVFAAALVVLADTVRKMLNGTAGWGDLAWALLDCIPATKGLTSIAKLGKLWKAGGLRALGAGAMGGIGGGLKNLANGIRNLGGGARNIFRGFDGSWLKGMASRGSGGSIPEVGAVKQALMNAGLQMSKRTYTAEQGHYYATRVFQGGRTDGTVLAGHGFLEQGAGTIKVPEGTSVSFYVDHGDQLGGLHGVAVEAGVYPGKAFDIAHANQEIPNYTLAAPAGSGGMSFSVMENSVTVAERTKLADLLKPGMGEVHWAACREIF
ncbi:putative adhesin [Streptomyces sp. NPDC058298]|uniref:putative adhesin n=1 Tax=Streptomyces sp. NPDC058298 TaxID=3346434 RepID=UPI0036EE0374